MHSACMYVHGIYCISKDVPFEMVMYLIGSRYVKMYHACTCRATMPFVQCLSLQDQYVFLFDAVRELLLCGDTTVHAINLRKVIVRMKTHNKEGFREELRVRVGGVWLCVEVWSCVCVEGVWCFGCGCGHVCGVCGHV